MRPQRLALALLPVLACASGVGSAPKSGPQSSPELRIVIVDVKGAVAGTRDGRAAQAELTQLFEKRQRDLDAQRDELAREREYIESQTGVAAPDFVAQRTAEYQRKTTELQKTFTSYEHDLQARQAQLTGPLVERMIAAIVRVAKRDGYALVLDRAAAPYASDALDLTDRMIKAYDDGL